MPTASNRLKRPILLHWNRSDAIFRGLAMRPKPLAKTYATFNFVKGIK